MAKRAAPLFFALCCRPPLAVVQKSTYAEQKRRKRIGFLANIEEPDSDQNDYHGHGYYFEHGVRSSAVPSAMKKFIQSRPRRLCAEAGYGHCLASR